MASTYLWKGRSPSGELLSGEYQTASKDELVSYLRKRKIIITSVKEKGAQVAFKGQALKIVSSFGIATPQDMANSIEDMMKVALGRLQKAGASPTERIVGGDEIQVVKPATLPGEIERAVAVLAQTDPNRLGDATNEALRRLLPFLQLAFKRVGIDLPVDKIKQMLDARK